MPVHMAVNRDYATADTVLEAGGRACADPAGQRRRRADEERGGGARVHVRVSEEPLSLQALVACRSATRAQERS